MQGPISPCQSMAVIGGSEPKTTQERAIYQHGCAVQLTTALEDVILPVCEQPVGDSPIDTRLLVSLLGINVQVEPPLQACL